MIKYQPIDKTQPLPEDRKGSTSLYCADKDLIDFARKYIERKPLEEESEGNLEKDLQ